MSAEPPLKLLLSANQLKRVPRTGWAMRGVGDVESVADHSFGVAFIALVLARLSAETVDTAKLLTIALIHDLPEAILSDIPSPAGAYLSPEAKEEAERRALGVLTAGLSGRDQWHDWWVEYSEETSIEGRLVRDADRLEMLLQAYAYEQTTGNRWLEEFWAEFSSTSFACDVSRDLFERLFDLRRRAREER